MSVNVIRWEQHGESMVIFQVQNPVTRNMIDLKPAIEVTSQDQASKVASWLEHYCKQAWDMRLDPKVIDASNWRDGEPVGL